MRMYNVLSALSPTGYYQVLHRITRAPRLRHVDFPNVVGLVTASRLFDGEAMACGLPETGKHKYPLARSSAGLFWFGVLRVFVYLICRYIDLRLGLLLLFVDSGR